jgi:CHAT domain-containing protein
MVARILLGRKRPVRAFVRRDDERAEALRQAELALIDGPGYAADGKTFFSYAHPIFWAPFAVIGDGGASKR